MAQEWVGTGVEGVLLNLLPHRCQGGGKCRRAGRLHCHRRLMATVAVVAAVAELRPPCLRWCCAKYFVLDQ